MRIILILLLLVAIVIIAGCVQQQNPVNNQTGDVGGVSDENISTMNESLADIDKINNDLMPQDFDLEVGLE